MSLGLSAGAIALIGAGATVAAPLIGGMMAGDSAQSAEAAQTQGAGEANATLQANYDQTRKDFSGYMGTGGAANNKLATYLGLDSAGSSGQGMTAEQFRAQFLPQYTKSIAATPGTPGMPATATQHPGRGADEFEQWIYSGGSNATPGAAASTQIDEAGLNNAIQQAMSKQQADQQAAGQASRSDPNFGMLTRQFDADALAKDLPYQNGLQWGLNEGTKGINNMASASGSQLSGATLKALTRFGNDYATTKTAGAADRYSQRQNQIYGMLSGTSNSGQQAAGTVSQAGQAMAGGVAANQTGLGNARGASQIAQGNALSGGLSGAVSGYQTNKLINSLTSRGTSGYGGGYTSSEPYPGYNASIGF